MFYSDPPYVLIAASLLTAAVCCYSFYKTLVGTLQDWSKRRSSRLLVLLQGSRLKVPLLGITLGATGFLSGSLLFFSMPPSFAYSFSALIAGVSVTLVWIQLRTLLRRLESGGVKALKLEELGLGEIPLPGFIGDDSN
ncbi:hypothetical protein NEA10_08485 [Phormidium yuhuli AB48]|uniref:Uncharacterized protein n=1 Tax=Phormidium yuhuli AB48 TaxID=2940671 RepID=A0ABY5AU34_9CYAN|nr:hypothetical protein [Phormidium yuhuli]USR92734.1 hypothetical protein NEA10_08485 [Phormidium yuhuli AB48]